MLMEMLMATSFKTTLGPMARIDRRPSLHYVLPRLPLSSMKKDESGFW